MKHLKVIFGLLAALITMQPVFAATQMYFVHVDHLGTPQVMTDESQAVVWQRNALPFGEVVQEIVSTDQTLQFPGQYKDLETNYFYNYFRDYDPTTGRYVQSDPIGLGGGINTYGYAYQNPLSYTDPSGLVVCGGACVAGGAVAVARFGQVAYRAYRAYSAAQVVQSAVASSPYYNEDASDAGECPALPGGLVGDQSDPRAKTNRGGKKHTSGPLTPENGGTGNFEEDLRTLAGPVRPAEAGDPAPPGSLIGENNIFGRPKNSSGGASIDIPPNGDKPHETLHY